MALTLRTVTNIGAPLYDTKGTLLANTTITFTLTDKFGYPRDAWDYLTNERVVADAQTVVTNAQGEFSIGLWPTSRAVSGEGAYYKVSVNHTGSIDFIAPLLEDVIPCQWVTLKESGGVLSQTQLTELAAHIQNASVHNTAQSIAEMTAVAQAAATTTASTLTANVVADASAAAAVSATNATNAVTMTLANNLIQTQAVLAQYHAFA